MVAACMTSVQQMQDAAACGSKKYANAQTMLLQSTWTAWVTCQHQLDHLQLCDKQQAAGG